MFQKPDFTMTELGRRLFVLGLDKNKRKDELWAEFAKFGHVTDVHNPGKGFAFVTFEMKDEAAVAMMKMNRTKMDRSRDIITIF